MNVTISSPPPSLPVKGQGPIRRILWHPKSFGGFEKRKPHTEHVTVKWAINGLELNHVGSCTNWPAHLSIDIGSNACAGKGCGHTLVMQWILGKKTASHELNLATACPPF